MFRFLLALCLTAGVCFGDTYNGPTDLSLKFYDDLIINGPAKLKMIKAKSLDVKGPLEFNRVAVSGKADVIGELKGEKGKFGQLSVTGPINAQYVQCDNLSVKGPMNVAYMEVKNQAYIEGPLTANHCRFKELTVQANQIVLENVDVESVFIKKGRGDEVLVLKGAAAVTGDVVFESGTGTVKVEGDKVRVDGQIKGGKRS